MFPHWFGEGTSAPTSAAAVVVYALNRNNGRIYFLNGEGTSSPTSATAVVCALNRKNKGSKQIKQLQQQNCSKTNKQKQTQKAKKKIEIIKIHYLIGEDTLAPTSTAVVVVFVLNRKQQIKQNPKRIYFSCLQSFHQTKTRKVV